MKLMIKYVGPVVVYNIINPQNYLLMTLDGKTLRGLFKRERLKPAILRTSKRNISNLSQIKANNKCRINNVIIIE